MAAHAKYLQMITKAHGNHKIKIFFDDKVDVEMVTLSYTVGSLVVEVGSSLGLWLGISVVGLFDVCVIVYGKVASYRKSMLCSQTKQEK